MGALVVGTFTHLGSSIIRGLWQENIQVFTADSARITRGSFSKCVTGHYTYTSPELSNKKFLDDIHAIVEKTGAKVLFPGNADMYYHIAKNKDVLSRSITIPIPDSEMIEQVRGKDRLQDICRELNILTPRTFYFSRMESPLEQMKNFEYPLLLKPVNRDSGKGIYFVRHEGELQPKLSEYRRETQHDDCLVQQYIEGTNVGVAYIYYRGAPVCGVAYRQIYNLPNFGAPTLTETCTNRQAENILKTVLDHYRWHGICQADIIIEDRTGKAYLHDINPRLFFSLYLTVVMGMNFPHILYKMAVQDEVDVLPVPFRRTKVLWLEGELVRRLACLKTTGQWKKIFDLHELKNINCIADFACGDFRPILFYPVWFISQQYQKKFRGAM